MVKLKILSGAVAVALVMAANISSAQETGWDFVGSWKMKVRCGDYVMTNNVKIKSADTSEILGTTNVDKGFGKIVGGSFDGTNVVFFNQFDYNGTNHSEAWKGVLGRNGNSFKGSFEGTLQGTCTFSGTRK